MEQQEERQSDKGTGNITVNWDCEEGSCPSLKLRVDGNYVGAVAEDGSKTFEIRPGLRKIEFYTYYLFYALRKRKIVHVHIRDDRNATFRVKATGRVPKSSPTFLAVVMTFSDTLIAVLLLLPFVVLVVIFRRFVRDLARFRLHVEEMTDDTTTGIEAAEAK